MKKPKSQRQWKTRDPFASGFLFAQLYPIISQIVQRTIYFRYFFRGASDIALIYKQ